MISVSHHLTSNLHGKMVTLCQGFVALSSNTCTIIALCSSCSCLASVSTTFTYHGSSCTMNGEPVADLVGDCNPDQCSSASTASG